MYKTITAALLAAAALSVCGCGTKSDPTLPTAEENASLANAAAMDTSPDSLAGGNAALGNGEDADDDEDVGNGA